MYFFFTLRNGLSKKKYIYSIKIKLINDLCPKYHNRKRTRMHVIVARLRGSVLRSCTRGCIDWQKLLKMQCSTRVCVPRQTSDISNSGVIKGPGTNLARGPIRQRTPTCCRWRARIFAAAIELQKIINAELFRAYQCSNQTTQTRTFLTLRP